VPPRHQGRAIALFQPFSSGRLLADEFIDRGWQTIAVLVEPVSAVNRDRVAARGYSEVITHTGDLTATASALRSLGVTAALSGDDTGIAVMDAIASLLGIPGNDPGTSSYRYDKSTMATALARAGVPVPHTRGVHSLPEALTQAASIGWPVIMKPVNSAGGDGVRLCANADDVKLTFGILFGECNRMGAVNYELLIQENLSGTLYDCNMVSLDGEHVVSEIWRDTKVVTPDGLYVYDYRDLMPPDFPDASTVVSYTRKVLDAVGISHGPSHTELFVTGRGPLLVETAARPAGLYSPSALDAAVGQDQITLTVEAIEAPERFKSRQHQQRGPQQYVRNIFLIADANGVLNPFRLQDLQQLRTLYSLTSPLSGGQLVHRTVDLFTCPSTFYLVGTPEDVRADYAAIRRWEGQDLYCVRT
jgi:hypothetical protein